MDLQKAYTNNTEVTTPLNSLLAGDVFRYAHISFIDALREDAFYMVTKQPEKRGIGVVNVKDGLVAVRDPDHRVIHHQVTLNIKE